ncbi:unnamed protein product [Coccothraustes coccothraustes]
MLAVLCLGQLLPDDGWERHFPSEISISLTSASLVACMFASNYSRDWKGTVLDEFEGCAENATVVRLRSSRLNSGRALRLPEAKRRLLRARSIVPVAVLSKARLLPKAARDRRLAPESSTLASFACVSACIFAESCSTLSHMEKLCKHRKFDATVPLTFVEFFASGC